MDVGNRVRLVGPVLVLACLHLLASWAKADGTYTVIDLGTGSPAFGTSSNGQGTVTGSNGLTYSFDASQVTLPSQVPNISQPVPNVIAPPIGSADTNGNPANAFSNSTVVAMNGQGLAAGFDNWGVAFHIVHDEAFAIQQQANGSWGTPVALWAGTPDFGSASNVGILGITPNGQILGYGYNMNQGPSGYGLYLYDSNSHSFTNLTSVMFSTMSPAQAPWILNGPLGQIDNQGRILLPYEAYEGYGGPLHTVLLVPQGISADPLAVPEPATWAIFATLLGAWPARNWLRGRKRGLS